jgi:hypothetical protein
VFSVDFVIDKCKKIDILKMDIEGTEFEIIDDILAAGIIVKQICMEIHPGYFHDRFYKSKELTHKLIKHGYSISHISRGGMGEELNFILT